MFGKKVICEDTIQSPLDENALLGEFSNKLGAMIYSIYKAFSVEGRGQSISNITFTAPPPMPKQSASEPSVQPTCCPFRSKQSPT